MPSELETLLTLRREAERAAEIRLAEAVAERKRRELAQDDLDRAWQTAQDAVRLNRHGSSAATAGAALAGERYRRELDRRTARAAAQAEAHRNGALAAAQAAEHEAQAAWTKARQARQTAEKLQQKARREAQKRRRQRAERAADEVAMAMHVRRRPDHH